MKRQSSKLVGTLLVTAVLGAWSSQAEATTIVTSPFGLNVPVDVVIGQKSVFLPGFGTITFQAVSWRNKQTDTCQVTTLGSGSGLSDNYRVELSNADDTLWIPGVLWSFGSCHGNGAALNYAGHFLDVNALSGNDALSSATGNTWLIGGAGNDWISTTNPIAGVFGEGGNDLLETVNRGGTGEVLSGGDGDDCLSDSSFSAAIIDCGAGNDRVVGSPGGATSCETHVSSCH